jgi:hypothetical protein
MQEVSQPRSKSASSPRLVCGAPLFSRSRLRRVSLAKYSKEHMHGFFQTYIANEQHQIKGQSTDAGCAYR